MRPEDYKALPRINTGMIADGQIDTRMRGEELGGIDLDKISDVKRQVTTLVPGNGLPHINPALIGTPKVQMPLPAIDPAPKPGEYTGKKSSYYNIEVKTLDGRMVWIDANAVIRALCANFAQGNIIKAIWRYCAASNLGQKKKGYDDAKYDLDKVVFYANEEIEELKKAE